MLAELNDYRSVPESSGPRIVVILLAERNRPSSAVFSATASCPCGVLRVALSYRLTGHQVNHRVFVVQSYSYFK